MSNVKPQTFQLTDTSPEAIQLAIVSAIQDPDIPKTYINGFNLAHSGTDMFLALSLSGKIFQVLFMSFNTAKTLAVNLQETITKFEQAIGQPLLTMAEIQEKTQQTPTTSTKQ